MEKRKKTFELEEEQGVVMLAANGFQQICPFQQPTPTPVKSSILGGQPQLQFLPKVCSSLCPHFKYEQVHYNDETKTHFRIELTCGNSDNDFVITSDIKKIERDSKGNVIQFNKQ